MINLIPPEGHRALKREYFLRVGATLGFLYGWIFILLGVALIPTYVLVNAQISTHELEVQQARDAGMSFEKADTDVRTTNAVLKQLKASTETRTSSEIIAEIQTHAASGITLTTFFFTDTQGVIEKVQIQGTAPTREALAQFKSALEASAMFEKAELPIADLAKDVDLPFAVTLSLAKS